MAGLSAGDLRDRIKIEKRATPAGPIVKAGATSWEPFIETWAQVQDQRPSRTEITDDGGTIGNARTRIIMRYREGVTSDMRVLYRGRVMQITSQIAVLGNREGLEFMVEDWTPQGERP